MVGANDSNIVATTRSSTSSPIALTHRRVRKANPQLKNVMIKKNDNKYPHIYVTTLVL